MHPRGKEEKPLDYSYRTTDREDGGGQSVPIPRYIQNCGKWLVYTVDKNTGEVKTFPYRCGSWSCPTCGPKAQERLRQKIASAGAEYNLKKFLTLTLPGEWHKTDNPERKSKWNGKDIEEAIKYLQSAWAKLRKRLARKFAEFKFFWVIETHRDGTPHMHGIISGDCDESTIRDMAVATGFGEQIKLLEGSIKNVSAYISKYMSKKPDELPKGARRYGHSKGIVWQPKKVSNIEGKVVNVDGLPVFRGQRTSWGPNEGVERFSPEAIMLCKIKKGLKELRRIQEMERPGESRVKRIILQDTFIF